MARIKFGQMISEARGKVAGMVFSKGKYGYYIRQKVSPVNPRTTAQARVRTYMAAASQSWKGLTENVRMGFKEAVADWKKTNVFGDSQTLSGYNLYTKMYKTALDINETPLTAYAGNTAPAAVSNLSVTADISDSKLELTFAPVIPVASKVKIFATPPCSAGRNFFKSQYRLLNVADSTDVSPLDLGADYIAMFGSLGQAGQKISIKMVPVLKATMKEGQAIEAVAVVTA